MSRLGKSPIPLPKGVEISSDNQGLVKAKGPKGERAIQLMSGVEIKVEENQVSVEKQSSVSSAFHGLYRALINNLITGVSQGFEKRLQLIGVGFRSTVTGNVLDLQIGYSHPTKLQIPSGIEIKVEKSNEIIVSGIDKQLVGQFAATIRAMRPPEPYKGKGIRYKDEHVRRKAGKSKGK